MKRRIAIILVAVFGLALNIQAQTDPTYRHELGGGVGLTNYTGDFNSSLLKNMQPAFGLVWRRVFTPFSSLRTDFSFTQLKGSSADETTYYPDFVTQRYDFKRTMWDLNCMYEYNFMPYGTGQDYRGAKRVVPYVFLGLGITSATGGEAENCFTANMPLGLGVKCKIKERLNLNIEWAMHFTLSDLLDGVKDPYYIKSSGAFKNTDCYSALRVSLTYSFSAKCPTCNKDDW